MKNLKNFIEEDLFATSQNTIGMGNPTMPTETEPGSGDIPQCLDIKTGKIYKRQRKLNRYKI